MKYGNVTGIDKPISRIVHGTIKTSSKELEKSLSVLDSALEHGINAFDTAHVYGGGDNERIVGRWVHERGIRDETIVANLSEEEYSGSDAVRWSESGGGHGSTNQTSAHHSHPQLRTTFPYLFKLWWHTLGWLRRLSHHHHT